MNFKNTLIYLIILINAISCGKNNINLNDVTSLYVASDNGLVLREKPNRQSKKIIVLPFNSRLQLLDDNGPSETINNKTNKWRKVKYNDLSGWIFGEYASGNKVRINTKKDEDLFKNTTWNTENSGFPGISLEFDSLNNFKLVVTGYKNNPRDGAILYGEWKIINDKIIFKFNCNNKMNCDYSDLVFNEKGRKYYENDGITILSKNEFSFNKNIKYIYFWGSSCKKVEPIISGPHESSRKWSTQSIEDRPHDPK